MVRIIDELEQILKWCHDINEAKNKKGYKKNMQKFLNPYYYRIANALEKVKQRVTSNIID